MRLYKLHQGPTADPYAELKAADKDPTKEIRCICCGSGEWYSSDSPYPWKWSFPPEAYEIRDKPKPKKVVKYLCYECDGFLQWKTAAWKAPEYWVRRPAFDKECEVEDGNI